MKNNSGGGIFAGFILLLLVLLGPCVLTLGILDLRNCMKSSKWPLTNGRILVSEVTQRESTDSDQRRYTVYGSRIEFEYWVGQQRYVSDNIRAAHLWDSSSSRLAERLVGRYPRGREVNPGYDPQSPQLAVLEPGIHAGDLGLIYFGAPFTMVSAYFISLPFRKRKSRKNAGTISRYASRVLRFIRKILFCRSFSQGVDSPNGQYTAIFGKRSIEHSPHQPEVAFECSVEMEEQDDSVVLFSITIEQAKALPNLLQINIEDIVKWDPTSALVVFKVTEPPIIVKAKELASQHRQAKTAC
jgi:hypothetical protein